MVSAENIHTGTLHKLSRFWFIFVYTYMHVATMNEKHGHVLEIEKVRRRVLREEREGRHNVTKKKSVISQISHPFRAPVHRSFDTPVIIRSVHWMSTLLKEMQFSHSNWVHANGLCQEEQLERRS